MSKYIIPMEKISSWQKNHVAGRVYLDALHHMYYLLFDEDHTPNTEVQNYLKEVYDNQIGDNVTCGNMVIHRSKSENAHLEGFCLRVKGNGSDDNHFYKMFECKLFENLSSMSETSKRDYERVIAIRLDLGSYSEHNAGYNLDYSGNLQIAMTYEVYLKSKKLEPSRDYHSYREDDKYRAYDFFKIPRGADNMEDFIPNNSDKETGTPSGTIIPYTAMKHLTLKRIVDATVELGSQLSKLINADLSLEGFTFLQLGDESET